LTPNQGFEATVLFKGEYYSNRCILYWPTACELFA